MKPMKTPGVYIVEKNAFPNSIVQVATAVPAFIGHTEMAMNGNSPLSKKPWRISSMAEFHKYFGGEFTPKYSLVERAEDPPTVLPALEDGDEAKSKPDDLPLATLAVAGADGELKHYDLEEKTNAYCLYAAMRLFFLNGGGPCWVVSIGSYKDDFDSEVMLSAIDSLKKEFEPTMVVIPETTRLPRGEAVGVQQHMLLHCGDVMKNRVAILDIFAGHADRDAGDPVAAFRNDVGVNQLDYGTAYYPWLHTTVFQAREFGLENLDDDGRGVLATLLAAEANPEGIEDEKQKPAIKTMLAEIAKVGDVKDEEIVGDDADKAKDRMMLDKMLRSGSDIYTELSNVIAERENCLPPGAAMAGIYTMVDGERGVWKAPANVSLNSVTAPTVQISHEDQEDLNVTPQGKSINAIRPFVGEGVLVWGARTLDGNSLDWRYVSVRRTMIMVEESVKLAAKAYVFEPNTASTWVTMRSMIENFLNTIWKQGGFAGAVPEDAYSVHVGLGETMTPVDILEGIMRITVLVAVTRPAEFIEITFQQQMQKS